MIETTAYEEEFYKDIEERMKRQKELNDVIQDYFDRDAD